MSSYTITPEAPASSALRTWWGVWGCVSSSRQQGGWCEAGGMHGLPGEVVLQCTGDDKDYRWEACKGVRCLVALADNQTRRWWGCCAGC
jgi:hypothetical protein